MRVAAEYKDREESSSLEFDSETGLPTDNCTTEAYKLLMSVDCPGGLTTPGLRRDFMRQLCSKAVRKNNPAHLFLACLLNQQRKRSWQYQGRFCKTILTTNFDHLLQDALQLVNVLYYMSDRPEVLDYLLEDAHDAIHLVYTHGSVHRYRLLNSTDEIEDGKKNSSSLRSHFERRGVIVMGYGGWADATMDALYQAHQFDGNLYWCVRRGHYMPETVGELLEKHSACAFKVTIPDADEAMQRIFGELTGSKIPELLEDPISLLTDQLDGLHFSEISNQRKTEKSEYIDSFNISIESSLARLRIAREAYIDPEKYRGGETAAAGQSHADEKSIEASGGMRTQAIVSKLTSEAIELANAGKLKQAIGLWNRVLKLPGISAKHKARTLINRGLTYGKLQPPRIEEELSDYSAVIAMEDAPTEEKAPALVNRGITYGELTPPRREEELSDYSAVIAMEDAPTEQKARALINRGIAYGQLDPPRWEEQIADYSAILDMVDAPMEMKARALVCRGVTFGEFEPPRREEEVGDYSKVIAMADAPMEDRAQALLFRGITYGAFEPPRRKEEIADYSAVVAMPEVPAELKAKALLERGSTYGDLEPPRREEEIADYSKVIATADAPPEERARALLLRGTACEAFEPPRREEAIADYSAIIAMPEVSAELKAKALLQRGSTYGDLEPAHREEELSDYGAVIGMPDAPTELKARALLNRGIAYSKLEPPRQEEELADYNAVIAMSDAPSEEKARALHSRAFLYGAVVPPRREEQLADYKAVIGMADAPDEEVARAHGHLGLLVFDEDENAQGLLDKSKKALEYEDHYTWRYNLGLAELFLGVPGEALKHCLPGTDECRRVDQIDDALQRLHSKLTKVPAISEGAYTEIVNKLKERRQELTTSG